MVLRVDRAHVPTETQLHTCGPQNRVLVQQQAKLGGKKVPMTTHGMMQAMGIKCYVCEFTLDMVRY